MARSDTRYSVYPARKAVEIVGDSSPALNQAIECWSALVMRAMADNAKDIRDSFETYDGLYDGHPLHEWALLAEVLQHVEVDPEFANPGQILSTAVADAHRLEDIGQKHFMTSHDFDPNEVDKAVRRLTDTLQRFDYARAWAVILAVRWYWENRISFDAHLTDLTKDRWWTLAYRRKWHEDRAAFKALQSKIALEKRQSKKAAGRTKTEASS